MQGLRPEGEIIMENKQQICDYLLVTLQHTRNQADLVQLKYDPDFEIVIAIWDNGALKHINVAMDSGTAMIRDIMRSLD